MIYMYIRKYIRRWVHVYVHSYVVCVSHIHSEHMHSNNPIMWFCYRSAICVNQMSYPAPHMKYMYSVHMYVIEDTTFT